MIIALLALLFFAFTTPTPAQSIPSQPTPTATKPAADFLSDSEVLARATALTLDERRYLVYLYARLAKPRVAETLAESILTTHPTDRQTLLVLASLYLEQKNAEATLRTARRFLAAYPNDHQGLYFLGAGNYLAKNFADANRVLRELKREQFVGRKFPYETDLAASAFAAGDWYRSMLAYQQLLRHHDLGDELRQDVRQALDGIYREHLPRTDLTAAHVSLDAAEVWRSGAIHGRHLSDRHWFELRYARDDISLEAAPGLQATRRDRAEVAASVLTIYNRRWRSDVSLGHSGEGAFGAARAHYAFARQREAALEFAHNSRATDSLTLEALDGRQHHLALATHWLIEADVMFAARAHARELHVARQSLGRGAGLDLNLDYTFRRDGPRVTAGYRGSVATFSRRASLSPDIALPIADPLDGLATQQAILANLVTRRINRHGTGALLTGNLADAWVYRLNAGVDYDFELATTGWNAALGLTFLPRKSIEIAVDAGYTSSATASNAGSAAILLNLSLRAHF